MKPPFSTKMTEIKHQTLRGGFKHVFFFTTIWGRFPFWLIFFQGVETTNQKMTEIKHQIPNFPIFPSQFLVISPLESELPITYSLERSDISSSEDSAVFSVLFLVASLCSFLAFLEKKNDVLVGFPCLQIHHFVGESPRAFPKTARLFVSRPSTECGPSVPDRCWARWTIPSSYPPWN